MSNFFMAAFQTEYKVIIDGVRRGAHLDTVLVAHQPSRRRVPAASRCGAPAFGLDSRGRRLELAGEDARATIGPRNDKDSVKMRPLESLLKRRTSIRTFCFTKWTQNLRLSQRCICFASFNRFCVKGIRIHFLQRLSNLLAIEIANSYIEDDDVKAYALFSKCHFC